jgi:hypothetical protein
MDSSFEIIAFAGKNDCIRDRVRTFDICEFM